MIYGKHQKSRINALWVEREQGQQGSMNSVIGNNRRSCASGFDPKLNPATAAVDQLKFFPEWECQHLTLLSERDGYFGDPLDENDDYCIYDMQILGYEKLTRGGFSMTALSQVSESISRDCKLAVRTNPTTPLSESPQDIRNFYSIQKTKRDNDTLTKKQRPLVRCIACESNLAQLDSSPSVADHDRYQSSVAYAASKTL